MTDQINSLIQKWYFFIKCRGNIRARKIVFDEIWITYHKRLLFFIRNLVKEDAEDVLQEIMLRVYNNLEKFNPMYSFNTWIFTVARNYCISYLKKRRVPIQDVEDIQEIRTQFSMDDSPDKHLLGKELIRKIDSVLAKQQSDYQQMAYLRYYEGISYKGISKIMNIPVGSVKSRIHLIKKELQTALEVYNAD